MTWPPARLTSTHSSRLDPENPLQPHHLGCAVQQFKQGIDLKDVLHRKHPAAGVLPLQLRLPAKRLARGRSHRCLPHLTVGAHQGLLVVVGMGFGKERGTERVGIQVQPGGIDLRLARGSHQQFWWIQPLDLADKRRCQFGWDHVDLVDDHHVGHVPS